MWKGNRERMNLNPEPSDEEIIKERERLLIWADELEIEFKNNMKTVNKNLSYLMQICKHSSITWYPDPSGNNDSCEVCRICGAEAKRLKKKD